LYSINQELFDDFIEFSKQSNKFEDKTCENIWNCIKNFEKPLTLASLHCSAKNDNPQEYKKSNK
jgi:hypothetical protein